MKVANEKPRRNSSPVSIVPLVLSSDQTNPWNVPGVSVLTGVTRVYSVGDIQVSKYAYVS